MYKLILLLFMFLSSDAFSQSRASYDNSLTTKEIQQYKTKCLKGRGTFSSGACYCGALGVGLGFRDGVKAYRDCKFAYTRDLKISTGELQKILKDAQEDGVKIPTYCKYLRSDKGKRVVGEKIESLKRRKLSQCPCILPKIIKGDNTSHLFRWESVSGGTPFEQLRLDQNEEILSKRRLRGSDIPFKSDNQLECYFNKVLGVGAKRNLLSGAACSFDESYAKLDSTEKRYAITSYYTDHKKLQNGFEKVLDEIASIDAKLGASELIGKSSCQEGRFRAVKSVATNKSFNEKLKELTEDPVLNKIYMRVKHYKSKKCSAKTKHKNQIDPNMVANAQDAYKMYQSALADKAQLKKNLQDSLCHDELCGDSNNEVRQSYNKAVAKVDFKISQIKNIVPQIGGAAFSKNIGKSNSVKMALGAQLCADRDLLLKRFIKLKGAYDCLTTSSKNAYSCTDYRETVASLEALPYFIPEEIEDNICGIKKDSTSGKRAIHLFNNYHDSSHTLSVTSESQDEISSLINNTIAGSALTVVTLPLSGPVALGRIAHLASAAKLANKFSKVVKALNGVSKSQRLKKSIDWATRAKAYISPLMLANEAALFGYDTVTAIKDCDKMINNNSASFERTNKGQKRGVNVKEPISCPNTRSPYSVAMADYKGCLLNAAFLITPAVAPTAFRVSKKYINKIRKKDPSRSIASKNSGKDDDLVANYSTREEYYIDEQRLKLRNDVAPAIDQREFLNSNAHYNNFDEVKLGTTIGINRNGQVVQSKIIEKLPDGRVRVKFIDLDGIPKDKVISLGEGARVQRVGQNNINITQSNPNLVAVEFPRSTGNKVKNSHEYDVSFQLKNGDAHNIKLYVPEGIQKADFDDVMKSVRETVGELPVTHVDQLKEIKVSPTANVSDATSGGIVGGDYGKDTLTYYPGKDQYGRAELAGNIKKDLTNHEFGHTISTKNYGTTGAVPENYRAAAAADGISISHYGSSAPHEDFAEAVSLYLVPNPASHAHYRQLFPNRFAELDKVFSSKPSKLEKLAALRNSADIHPSTNAKYHKLKDEIQFEEIVARKKKLVITTTLVAASSTAVVSTGGALYYYKPWEKSENKQ